MRLNFTRRLLCSAASPFPVFLLTVLLLILLRNRTGIRS